MLCAGQVYRATITVYDLETQPSTATLTITKPDGTSETETGPWSWDVADGDYTTSYDYTLTTAGLYKFAWVTAGPGTAPAPEYVTVRDFISLISLSEAKAHLNSPGTTADDELRNFMQAATEVVEARGGPTIRRQVTDTVSDGQLVLAVPRFPVLSVQSVTSIWPGGPAWTADQLQVLDAAAGLIGQSTMTAFWWGPWNVAYTVGRVMPLEKHLQACKEQLRHLWETQRGAQPPSVLAGEEVFTSTAGWSFSVPRRVLELLEDEMTPAI